jgi:hypothetical protein
MCKEKANTFGKRKGKGNAELPLPFRKRRNTNEKSLTDRNPYSEKVYKRIMSSKAIRMSIKLKTSSKLTLIFFIATSGASILAPPVNTYLDN